MEKTENINAESEIPKDSRSVSREIWTCKGILVDAIADLARLQSYLYESTGENVRYANPQIEADILNHAKDEVAKVCWSLRLIHDYDGFMDEECLSLCTSAFCFKCQARQSIKEGRCTVCDRPVLLDDVVYEPGAQASMEV